MEQEQLCSHKAGDNTHSPGPSLVKATHRHSLGISYKLLPQERADDMNLLLKDGTKKLGMVFTQKLEAEMPCYSFKQRLYTCDCSMSSTSVTATILAQNLCRDYALVI